MSVALIGAGTISACHLAAHREVGHPVSWVVDVDPSRAANAAAQWGVPRWSTCWQDAVEDRQVAIVDICTPPATHAAIALAALEAGKHLICEKPLAPNLAECDQIVHVASRAPGKLLVVHQFRCLPIYQRMKWLLDRGELGKVYFARVQRYDPPPVHLVEQSVWGRWDLAGGGVLMTKAIHQLDMLLGLLGPVRKVQAMMGTAVWKIESEDHLTANLQFASGALASIAVVGQRYGGYGQHFDLFGDRAAVGLPWHMVSMDGRHNDALLETLRREVPDPEEGIRSGWRYFVRRIGWKLGRDWFAPRPVNSHTPIFRAFATALRDDTSAPVTAEEGRAAVELCLAIYQSAITGQAVELPLDAQSPFYAGVPRDEYAKLAASVAR